MLDDALRLVSQREGTVADALGLVRPGRGGQTFWLSSSDEPRCSFERLALDVLQFHTHGRSALLGDTADLAAEWWVQAHATRLPRPPAMPTPHTNTTLAVAAPVALHP